MEEVIKYIVAELRQTIKAQGHTLTGKLEASIEGEVTQTANGFLLNFYHENYGTPLNKGVPASKIPFQLGSGKSHSLYIAALQNYVKLRMAITGEKESLGVAFAIAMKHKREGNPTASSYKYSSTGNRKFWIDQTLNTKETEITRKIEDALFHILENIVANIIL